MSGGVLHQKSGSKTPRRCGCVQVLRAHIKSVCTPSATSERKALQNTGPPDFRQSQFVDTRYTLGYTWWFLSVTGESCWRCGSSVILQWVVLRCSFAELAGEQKRHPV